jgi:hypothetical protein
MTSAERPSARNHAAFDRHRGRMVHFGVHDGDFVFGNTSAQNPCVEVRSGILHL